ncbi:hypothetical protein [Rhizobium sp. SSA_523]|uniref:hypothetical protein n=1 Tax=Rhizobium sp. SSA_523 TaxID=2952477 RepID=UPI002091D7B1|nr:hypothetical protein [Rhizobium sp. SSA_523]MCO5731912.1 hypothetical protein [Rhizobium sp. SSA_523]WKC22734.1 hypothetical protein QTJ18_17970 [Rhizobium sp. SSA_523]
MQIESRLSGYGYPAKPQIHERKPEAVQDRAVETRRFHDGALTGSSTLLSSSLANALWVVEESRQAEGAAASTVAQIEDIYSEF